MASERTKLPRRAFLACVGRAGKGLTAASLLHATPGFFGPGVARASARRDERTGDLLAQPPELRSKNGVLDAALVAASGSVRLGDDVFEGSLYNNSYLPPLLRVRTGDVMRIAFKNDLPADPSNLHFHGMSVSPNENSDNVFVHVHPGHEFNYVVNIPPHGRQGPGLFWYHPHAHGFVAKQMLGGMSGGLVVDGFEQYFPIVQDLPERFLFIKHVELGGREVISINGQVKPVIEIRPGEAQFWRIAHIGATLFLKFRIEGMPLYVVATDGHPLSRPQRMTEFFVGPGQRIEAIVLGPAAGEWAMSTMPFQNQAWKAPDPAQQIATIVATGRQAPAQVSEPDIMDQRARGARWIDEIRTAPIARHRTLDYSRTDDRQTFMIDGRVMDEDRIDQTVKFGDTEEWTVINTDQQYHSFHIHQTAFLVTAINGVARDEDGLRDTFSVPPATDLGPSSLKVINSLYRSGDHRKIRLSLPCRGP
jgi:suppressor of ftsI